MIIGNTAGFPASGKSWRQLTGAGTRNWRGLAISANGQYMAGGEYGGMIYVSSDYGVTWSSKVSNGNWTDISMSDSGQYIVAGTNSSSPGSRLSRDYGATWVSSGTSEQARGVGAIRPDGQTMLQRAGVEGNTTATPYYYTNVPSGITGSITNMYESSTVIGFALAGSRVVASVSGGSIWTSTNGTSFTQASTSGSRSWRKIAISSDGNTIVSVVGNTGGYIYRSADGGATWTEITADGSKVRWGCAMSADGQVIAVTEDAANGQLSLSFDGGTTWAAQPDAGTAAANYYACAVTPDGSKVLAAPYGGGVFLLE